MGAILSMLKNAILAFASNFRSKANDTAAPGDNVLLKAVEQPDVGKRPEAVGAPGDAADGTAAPSGQPSAIGGGTVAQGFVSDGPNATPEQSFSKDGGAELPGLVADGSNVPQPTQGVGADGTVALPEQPSGINKDATPQRFIADGSNKNSEQPSESDGGHTSQDFASIKSSTLFDQLSERDRGTSTPADISKASSSEGSGAVGSFAPPKQLSGINESAAPQDAVADEPSEPEGELYGTDTGGLSVDSNADESHEPSRYSSETKDAAERAKVNREPTFDFPEEDDETLARYGFHVKNFKPKSEVGATNAATEMKQGASQGQAQGAVSSQAVVTEAPSGPPEIVCAHGGFGTTPQIGGAVPLTQGVRADGTAAPPQQPSEIGSGTTAQSFVSDGSNATPEQPSSNIGGADVPGFVVNGSNVPPTQGVGADGTVAPPERASGISEGAAPQRFISDGSKANSEQPSESEGSHTSQDFASVKSSTLFDQPSETSSGTSTPADVSKASSSEGSGAVGSFAPPKQLSGINESAAPQDAVADEPSEPEGELYGTDTGGLSVDSSANESNGPSRYSSETRDASARARVNREPTFDFPEEDDETLARYGFHVKNFKPKNEVDAPNAATEMKQDAGQGQGAVSSQPVTTEGPNMLGAHAYGVQGETAGGTGPAEIRNKSGAHLDDKLLSDAGQQVKSPPQEA